MSSLAIQAIITKGLTCGATTACQSGTVIMTGPWQLFCLTSMPEPVILPPGAAGGKTLQPGEIARLYQPVPDEWQYIQIPRDKEAEYFRKRKVVKVEFNFKSINITKEYSIPEEKAKIIYKLANMYNVTRDRITVGGSFIKRLYTTARVRVTGFRIKR